MDYMELAHELLIVHQKLLHDPTHQKISKIIRGELFVLNYLSTQEGDVHPKELSERMAVSTARIANLLNHLEEKKLVQRHVDPQDNRQFIVVLTEDGRQLIEKIRSDLLIDIRALLERLGPEDTEAFLRILKKLLSHP